MRFLLVLTSMVLLAAGPALASGKTTGKKPYKADKTAVCDGLVEKKLQLAIELETLDSRRAEKSKAMKTLADVDAKELPTVDMTGSDEVVDLTKSEDDKLVKHQARVSKIVTLQNEIATLDQDRLDVERRAAKVSSTLSQSCPK